MKVFIEEQKFTKPLVIIALSIAFIGVVVSNIKDWEKIAQGSISEKIGALSGFLLIIAVAFLFINLKLKTKIDENGVHYQFFPINISFRLIAWDSISNCYLRKYNAVFEYGGWGMKFNFTKKIGRSFTTKGNIGLQLKLKNGKKILIGTQRKEEIERVLRNYHYKISNNEI